MLESKEILIAKYLSGNISSEENTELAGWLKASSLNQVEFNRIKKLWDTSLNLKKESHIDVDKAWSEFNILAESQTELQIKKSKFSPLKMAAAIALLITTIIVVKLFIPKTGSIIPTSIISEQSPAMIVVSTGDSAKEFFLPDSSQIFLYKNSQFIYPTKFNKLERITFLRGEAFFEVRHNKIPFVAFCQKTRTKDLGTSFNIKGYEKDKEIEVIVVTGKVEFSNNDDLKSEKIILRQNEKVKFFKGDHFFSKSKNTRKDFKNHEKNNLLNKLKKFIKKVRKK